MKLKTIQQKVLEHTNHVFKNEIFLTVEDAKTVGKEYALQFLELLKESDDVYDKIYSAIQKIENDK